MRKNIFAALLFLSACATHTDKPAEQFDDPILGVPVRQITIGKVEAMPNIPDTYAMLDWRQKALDYDAYVFDWNRTGPVGPLIWLDDTHRNGGGDTFGLYTTVGDARQGPSKPAGHEAINTIAAVMGGGLVGIDKTAQDGYNYAKMVQNYFAVSNDWNIMLNNTGGFSKDWWYNMLPNLLYYGVCDLFPQVDGARDIQQKIADQFVRADAALGDDYNWSFFNYGTLVGGRSGIPPQQDAAGGHAYILLNAYRLFGNAEYLEHVKHALDVLNNQTESRFYEIILPFGIYAAAYMNAAEGTDYDITKMFNWVFNGGVGRKDWGVIVGKWGDYCVYGLQGSITDGGGYAFQMNSYEMAWPLVPLVKYQPAYARMIGLWMLNNASASRHFFPSQIADANQSCADIKDLTNDIVGYEGLRYTDRYGVLSTHPVAQGDGPSWTDANPSSTMFSLYSTSPVGIFGAIISTTDVEGILSLDCNATDFYAPRPYPVHLLYNPYKEAKTVSYYPSGRCDLFDSVARDYVAKDVSGIVSITIPADKAMVITEMPSGTELKEKGGRLLADRKNVIAW